MGNFMQANIQKWGNSLAIRIPSYVANKLSIENGDTVDLIANDHQIIIQPKKHSLASMLDQITEENLHKQEWNDLDKKGREAW